MALQQRQHVQEFIAACQANNADACQTALGSLLNTVLSSNEIYLSVVTKVCKQIKDGLTNKENVSSLAPIIVDVLWLHTNLNAAKLLDQSMVDNATDLSPSLQVIQALLETLHEKEDALIDELILSSLDATLLQQLGILKSAPDLQKKLRLFNTQNFYRQHKFNLLAEESQGYAKLLHLLYVQRDASPAEYMLRLVGTFSLDPNRCLDLTLLIMLNEPEFANPTQRSTEGEEIEPHVGSSRIAYLTTILKSLPTANLAKLAGFAISNESENEKKLAWVRLLAYLITLDTVKPLVSIEDVMLYLPPWQDKIMETYQAHVKEERNRVRSLGRVRLSSGSGSGEGGKNDAATAVEAAVRELSESVAVRLIIGLLDGYAIPNWPILFAHFDSSLWVPFCTLFKSPVGEALCEWVYLQLKKCYQVYVCPPWSTAIPQDGNPILSIASLFALTSEPLKHIKESGSIELHPTLYCELCRLFYSVLSNVSTDEKARDLITSNVKHFLLPCLSIFSPNAALSAELWKVLDLLPYKTRYDCYRLWRGRGLERAASLAEKPLWLIEGECNAGRETRYSLKRLSKDTIRDICRAVAKICHSHPLVVFTTILSQIESYDNLVQVMVDALHFVSTLSLDVLGFCILERLSGSAGGVNRSRLKEDGINLSQWLQSLEAFTGAFYRQYPNLELRGILSYLLDRLKEGQVMDVGVLRTLLKVSGGWAFADYSPAASLSSTQLEGRAGSTLLKRETMSFGVTEKLNPQATEAIRSVLQENDVGVSLLILLAQVKHVIIFGNSVDDRQKPVKLVGNLVDSCQVVMSILIDFLTEVLVGDSSAKLALRTKLAASMPPLADLMGKYGMDVASAWMLCRPLVRSAFAGKDENVPHQAMASFAPNPNDHSIYNDLLPSVTWNNISCLLLTTFFRSSSYDLFCPENLYTTEVVRLQKEVERVKTQKTFSATALQTSQAPAPVDFDEVDRINNSIATLKSDMERHKTDMKNGSAKIIKDMASFFVSDNHQASATTFLTQCVYPRTLQGPDDALFCVRFVMLLHEQETPKFGTLHFFDALYTCLPKSLFGLTEGEASNVSILLFELWKHAKSWRYDEGAYESIVMDKLGSFMWSEGSSMQNQSVSVEEYESLFKKWQYSIGVTALGCLRSMEYMHLRNCLIVLTRMVEVYPTRPDVGNRLLQALGPLQEDSFPFPDIKASAQAYSMQLCKARDEGVWCEEDEATVQARLMKEKEAAAARQKKAEKQMDEITKEAKMISEEISFGNRDGRDRRRGPSDGRRNERVEVGHGSRDDRASDDRRRGEQTRNTSPLREPIVGGGDRELRPQQQSQQRDRTVRSRSHDRGRRNDGGRDDGGRGMEGRWQRPEAGRDSRGIAGSKRSRQSSPEPGEEPTHSKRPRVDNDDDSRKEEDRGRRGSSGRRSSRRRNLVR